MRRAQRACEAGHVGGFPWPLPSDSFPFCLAQCLGQSTRVFKRPRLPVMECGEWDVTVTSFLGGLA